MVDPITDAESLCRRTLEEFGSLQNSSSERIVDLRNKLQDLLMRIAESKKKIMVRSPQGRELSTEALTNVSRLYEVVASLPQRRLDEKAAAEVCNLLGRLQDSVEKLEIYWKSFEYVTT